MRAVAQRQLLPTPATDSIADVVAECRSGDGDGRHPDDVHLAWEARNEDATRNVSPGKGRPSDSAKSTTNNAPYPYCAKYGWAVASSAVIASPLGFVPRHAPLLNLDISRLLFSPLEVWISPPDPSGRRLRLGQAIALTSARTVISKAGAASALFLCLTLML